MSYAAILKSANNTKCETAYVYFKTEGPDTGCTKEFPHKGRHSCYYSPADADESLYVKTEDGRFKAYGDGVVLDKETKLMWAAKDNGVNMSGPSARVYCENYRGGGYADWRMPSCSELDVLLDKHLQELINLTSNSVRGTSFNGYLLQLCSSTSGVFHQIAYLIFCFNRM